MDWLKEILSAIEEDVGVRPHPFSVKDVFPLPAVSYQVYEEQDDGAVSAWRLTVRVSAESLVESLTADKRIKSLLVTVGDEERFGCKNVVKNGGGTLCDESGVCQTVSYYDIIRKTE